MLRKVISGGQVGADIAGLRAAKAVGLETGGWMPRGFKTRNGYSPKYAKVYGMVEHASPLYPPRTFQNALEADATIRLAYNFNSPGERCTLTAITRAKTPHMDIDLRNRPIVPTYDDLAVWLDENEIEVLNVAGNADVGIESVVEKYLTRVFKMLVSDG